MSTTTSLVVLGVLTGTGALPGLWANLIATAVGTGPSFELNRRWVWGKQGPRSVAREVGPFCALSFLALGVSTLAVGFADQWAVRHGLIGTQRALLDEAASVLAFGSLWILQYLLLDRVLFRPTFRQGG